MGDHLLLIRHAESEWNAAGRWQGHGDPPLSERGRAQARELATELAEFAIDRVFSSDLRRAVETAETFARPHRLDVEARPGLRELDVGRWEGRTRAEIEAFDPVAIAAFDRGDVSARAGGGESRADLSRRIAGAVATLLSETRGQRIAIVTHLGVLRTLLPGADPENAEWRRAGRDEVERISRP